LKNGGGEKKKEKEKKSKSKSSEAAAVIDLTESTFDPLVMQSEELWLVEFFAPWCGHCKNLAPHWAKAATELGGVAKLGAVDATVHAGLASKYGIKGYPTIKVFRPGKKGSPEDYQGGRTSSDIVTYVKNIAESIVPSKPKRVVEFVDQEVFDENCGDSTCIIAVLPHILDSHKDGRDAYIDTLKEVAAANMRKPFNFGWIEIGSQPEFEAALTQEFGGIAFPPAVVAVNVKKGRHVMMTGAFNSAGINRFIGGVISGSERTVALPNSELKLNSIQAWDGKDAVLPEVDEEKSEL